MLIKTLKINNLRNIESVDLEADPGLNVLVGENGAGKTSVLESMILLAKGRSFRSRHTEALIGPKSDEFRIHARIVRGTDREHVLGLERSRDRWRARRDGEDVKQLGDLAADLPLVLLEPNSHMLVSGPPDGRRKFLDWAVFHVEHSFLGTWRRYSRALKQRNAALKARDPRMVNSLNPLVADLGQQIDELRQGIFVRLAQIASRKISRLSPELPGISIKYRRGWSGDDLRSALEAGLRQDLERGTTGMGPHRGDLVITVDNKPAREHLSRGEQKSVAAALLLSQSEIMMETGEMPVLLLDDLASELDARHRDNLLASLMDMGAQVWVTGTTAEPYLSITAEERRMFHVEHGKIFAETAT